MRAVSWYTAFALRLDVSSASDWVSRNYRGMMTQAVQQIARFALGCSKGGNTPPDSLEEPPPPLRRLQITTCTENKASIALALRLGATQEGVLREYELLHGRWVDHACFGLLATDAATTFEEGML